MSCISKKQLALFRQYLSTLGIRDTDFDDAEILRGDEYVAIIQDGVNKKVKISDLFLNFSDETVIEHMLKGDPGDSAYEIWLQQPGNAGKSVAEFLASLKGKDGKDGKDGADGSVGPAGPAGIVNATAYVGENDGGDPDVSVNKVGNELNFIFKNLGNGGGSHDGGDDSDFELKVADVDVLGGVELGYPTNGESRNYALQLDGEHRAFVNVPWTGGGGGEGETGGHWENAYKRVTDGTVPVLPINGAALDPTYSVGWDHYVPNVIVGSNGVIWMATRWVEGNVYDDWKGPWRISAEDGDAGADGDELEFIYARTISEDSTALLNPNSGEPSEESESATPAGDEFVPDGWYDSAYMSEVEISETNRVMWMCFRIKHDGAWGNFIGPFMWSVWGKAGVDGDGVEYIYCAGDTLSAADPTLWTYDTDFQEREYIPDAYKNKTGGWYDNPLDLADAAFGPGTYQWVSTRKKYADTTPHATYGDSAYWHAYSTPVLWNYYPKDGDAGTGIVADLDNEVMAVSIGETGDCNAFSQSTGVSLYNGVSLVNGASVTLDSIKDTSNTSYDNDDFNGGNNLVSISGTTVTITLAAGDINLESKNLLVKLNVSGEIPNPEDPLDPIQVTRPATLSLVGVKFGSDGHSYRLITDTKVIHNNGTSNVTAQVNISCAEVDGTNTFSTFTPTTIPAAVDGKTFKFKYTKNNSSTKYDVTSQNYISTSGVTSILRVYLYYGNGTNDVLVDQEGIYVVSDGLSADPKLIKFKSTVFKRAAEKPIGVMDQKGVTSGQSNYGGTFINPVPAGWSDGIPAYDNRYTPEENSLWMSVRTFASDHTSSGASSASDDHWSEPVLAVESDIFKIAFAYKQGNNDGYPATPNDNDSTGNMHRSGSPYGHSSQVWFEPGKDDEMFIDSVGIERRDWENMYWRAERHFSGGSWGDWIIVRIKGEKGVDGSGVDGKDALPLRIRQWSEVYQKTLADEFKVFSGFEANAPFKDIIVFTLADYIAAGGDEEDYPFTTDNARDPVLLAVNYNQSYPNGYNGNNLPLPDGSQSSQNYTGRVPKNASESASFVTSGFIYSKFLNFGAIYTQLLVATQGYIGNLTVEELLANNATVNSIIVAGGKLGPFTVGHDSEGDIDYLVSTLNDSGPNFKNITEFELDQRGITLDERKEKVNDSSTYCSSIFDVGTPATNSGSGRGFVKIDCSQTSSASGSPHYDCGLKVNAPSLENAAEFVGDVKVTGTVKGGVLAPIYVASDYGYTTIPITGALSGTNVYADVASATFQLPTDPENGFYLDFACDKSCTVNAGGSNTIKGLAQSGASGSYSLNSSQAYRLTFVNRGGSSSNNFWFLSHSY